MEPDYEVSTTPAIEVTLLENNCDTFTTFTWASPSQSRFFFFKDLDFSKKKEKSMVTDRKEPSISEEITTNK